MGSLMHRVGKLSYPLLERFSRAAWNNVPRPQTARAITRGPGHDADRVLLAGGSSAVGWGVVSHDLALAGHLARATAAITRRGVDVEVWAHPRLTIPEIRDFIADDMAARYDAIVFTLGGRESYELMPTRLWRRQVADLLATVIAHRAVPPAIVVVGAEEAPPVPVGRLIGSLAMARARSFNRATRELIAGLDRVRYVDSAMVPEGHEREFPHGVLDIEGSRLYERVAHRIAPPLADLLDRSPARVPEPVNDAARRDAIRLIDEESARHDPRLIALLTTVRDVLHMRSADLFLVDEEEVRLLAATTPTVERSPRADTLSDEVLRHRTGLIIHDLARDDRYRDRASVVGPPWLRFYAGYPVESRDGQRVAVLAVVDIRSHEFEEAELSLLRSFASQVGDVLFP